MNIEFSLYELYPLHALNSRSTLNPRSGALLKVHFEDESWGYADLHPWPELGDMTLSQQLLHLKNKKISLQCQESLHFAALESEARKQKIPLFQGLQNLENHFLMSNLNELNENLLIRLKEQNFRHLKIKLSPLSLKDFLSKIDLLTQFRFQLRLDFNSSLTYAQSYEFYHCLEKDFKSLIETVEDPCLFEKNNWFQLFQKSGVPLALDENLLENFNFEDSYQYLVYKPALQDDQKILNLNFKKILITSYMDHPLGQICALYKGALLNTFSPQRVLGAGFLSHFCYKKSPCSDMLIHEGPYLKFPTSSNWGFDEILEKLKWKNLSSL